MARSMIVLRHVLLAGGDDGRAQPRVHRRIGLAHLGRDGDFPRQLAEQFRLLGILPALAVHDVLELGMAGHAGSLGFVRDGMWVKARPYRPATGQNQRFAAVSVLK